jgi:hypothetical protein
VVRSADLDGNVLIRGPGIGSGLESSPPGTPVWQRDPATGRITTVDLSGRVTVWDPNDPFYSDGAPPMPEGATQVDPLTGITTHVDPNTGAVTVTIPEIPGLPDDTTPADLDPLGGSVLGALPANPTANLAGKHGAADGSFNASACVLDAQAGGAVSPGEAILACADAATAWKNTQAPAVQSPMAQAGPEPSPSTEPLPICQGVHYPPIGMSGTQQAESVLWASLPADPPAAFGEIGAFWDGVVASVAEWCTCGGNHGNSDKNKGKEKDKGDKDDDNDNKGDNDKTKEREARDAEKQKADENQGITIISHEPLPAANNTGVGC